MKLINPLLTVNKEKSEWRNPVCVWDNGNQEVTTTTQTISDNFIRTKQTNRVKMVRKFIPRPFPVGTVSAPATILST